MKTQTPDCLPGSQTHSVCGLDMDGPSQHLPSSLLPMTRQPPRPGKLHASCDTISALASHSRRMQRQSASKSQELHLDGNHLNFLNSNLSAWTRSPESTMRSLLLMEYQNSDQLSRLFCGCRYGKQSNKLSGLVRRVSLVVFSKLFQGKAEADHLTRSICQRESAENFQACNRETLGNIHLGKKWQNVIKSAMDCPALFWF